MREDLLNNIAGHLSWIIFDILKKFDTIEDMEQFRQIAHEVVDEEVDGCIKDYLKKLLEMNGINNFVNDFIKVSNFADKSGDEYNKLILKYVNITDYELMACDGYKAIILRSTCIPEALKNTKIKWDVRSDFEAHAERDVGDYIDLKRIFKKAKDNAKHVIKGVSAKNFDTIFQPTNKPGLVWDGVNIADGTITTLTYADAKVSFNKEFIDLALTCLGDDEFDVYISNQSEPVVFENVKMSIIVLPILCPNEDV